LVSAKLLIWGNFPWWERERRYSEGFTGLHCAGYLGLDEIAISLLEEGKGCSADMADGWGRTPLMWAAESGREEMVKLLLCRKDIKPDSGDGGGRTPLWFASKGGHEEVVKLLLGLKKVNPNSRDRYGSTPRWYEVIAKLLYDRKEVNPDSGNNYGQTPILCAAKGGHEGIVKLLLGRKEVNPDSRDYHGQTPLLCAAEGGHEGIVKLLLDRKEVNPDSRAAQTPHPISRQIMRQRLFPTFRKAIMSGWAAVVVGDLFGVRVVKKSGWAIVGWALCFSLNFCIILYHTGLYFRKTEDRG